MESDGNHHRQSSLSKEAGHANVRVEGNQQRLIPQYKLVNRHTNSFRLEKGHPHKCTSGLSLETIWNRLNRRVSAGRRLLTGAVIEKQMRMGENYADSLLCGLNLAVSPLGEADFVRLQLLKSCHGRLWRNSLCTLTEQTVDTYREKLNRDLMEIS